MKTTEEIKDWIAELKAERRGGLVTQQMVLGNTGALSALKWVLDTKPDADAVRLKINELHVKRNEMIADEMAGVGYGAMAEALKWVLRDD
jgi:hypothetical protein